jgi:phospholipase/carboxylesterase
MRRLGSIHCLEKNVSDNINNNGTWLILFHGFGADAKDLFSLSEITPAPENLNWLFPNGPLEVSIGPGATGRAWWPIDMAAFNAHIASGISRDMSKDTPVGLESAFEKSIKMIQDLRTPWNKIIIGGFSQGAMLATELFLRAPESPKGLVFLSGTTLHADQWRDLATTRKGVPFFMSHGDRDPVLGIKYAQMAETIFTQAGMIGRLHTFSGGHEIPEPILQKLGGFLTSLH